MGQSFTNTGHDTAGIHFRRFPEVNANIYGNSMLVKALGDLGMDAVLIPNKDAYQPANEVVRAYPLSLDNGSIRPKITVGADMYEYPLGKEGVATIRARVGLSQSIEQLASVVNDQATREIGIDKWRQYLICADVMPITRLVEPSDQITDDLIADIPGNKLVIKRVGSSLSQWLSFADKTVDGAGTAVSEMRSRINEKLTADPQLVLRKEIILQEYVPGERIIDVQPMNAEEATKYNELGTNGHELRFYCYPQRTGAWDFYGVLRAFDDGKQDDWIFIDQDEIPQAAVILAEQVSNRVIRDAHSAGGLVAVDLFRGQRHGHDQSEWLVREINTKDPQMALPEDSQPAARIQREKLAVLLRDLSFTAKNQGI